MFRLYRGAVVLAMLLGIGFVQGFSDEVDITTHPVTVAQVGQLYEYDVDAVSSDSGDVIRYSLREKPTGMSINDSTGLIRWTPMHVGAFRVKIRAQGNSSGGGSGHDDQEYTLRVLSGLPSSLRGTVRSLASQPVANVRLRLFETATGRFVFNERSDSAGAFNFTNISPGTYFLRAMPRGNSPFLSQWYDRAQRIQDATAIVVAESSVVTIAVTLLTRDTTQFALSGTVRDTSGNPIAAAKVSIFRDRRHDDLDPGGINFRGLDDDDRDRDLAKTVFSDSMGNYQARLRPHRYIIVASKHGFRTQFWNHKENPLDADRLDLRTDTSGINFDLSPILAATGAIEGTITAASIPVQSHVIGFHRSTPNGRFTGFIRHTQTDSSGTYRLGELRSGFYIVLALPQGQFLPTFYDTSGGTTDFRRAFPVSVGNGLVQGINIHVLPDTVAGLNRVRGIVTTGTLPLAGTLVYAVSTQGNETIGAAVSSSDGKYAVVGMQPGSYLLMATKPGYELLSSAPFVVQHNGGNPSTVSMNLDLIQSPTSIDDPAAGQPVSFELRQNYPNPFNPNTTISYQLKAAGFVRLKVFDVLGREVATLLDEQKPVGEFTVSWDASSVGSGMYFARLESNGKRNTIKMLLMK